MDATDKPGGKTNRELDIREALIKLGKLVYLVNLHLGCIYGLVTALKIEV